MYVHLWATQSMNQEFKFITAQNNKNLRLNGQNLYESFYCLEPLFEIITKIFRKKHILNL